MALPGRDDTVPAQIYATCAQIQVVSDVKNGTLPKGIRIPEDYTDESPGMPRQHELAFLYLCIELTKGYRNAHDRFNGNR
jgi:hypothetical protein